MDGNYTKREIDLMFKGVSQHLLDVQKTNGEMLSRILEQTTQHNHRMTKIETKAIIQDTKIVDLEKQDIIVKGEITKYVLASSAVIGTLVTVVNLFGKYLLS